MGEIGQYSGGLVEFKETIQTWGLATAKERFKINAKSSGLSLEQALQADSAKGKKSKARSAWRASDEQPDSRDVLKARMGAGGMPRKSEVQVLRAVDKHLHHQGRRSTPLVIETANGQGPPFNTMVV